MKRIWILLLVCSLVLAGCKGGVPDQLSGLTDDASRQRLDKLADGTPLLISLHGDGGLGSLPELGGTDRVVGEMNGAKLVTVDRRRAEALADVKGVRKLILWGDERALNRLDPMLSHEVLSSLAQNGQGEAELKVIGTFDATDETIPLILSEYGLKASGGKAGGGVATFRAPLPVILDLLNDNRVIQLKKPALLGP